MPNLKHLPLTGPTINWFLKYSEYRTSELSMYMWSVMWGGGQCFRGSIFS